MEALRGDVTGDGLADTILLVGDRFDDSSQYMKRLWIIVRDQTTRKQTLAGLPQNSGGGYGARVGLYDLTGDGAAEVMVSAGTGGSSGIINYHVFTFAGGAQKTLLTPKDVALTIAGSFAPGYRAQLFVIAPERVKVQSIDLKGRKQFYIERGVYLEGGAQLKPVDLWGGNTALMVVEDVDGDGIYEIRVTAAVKGLSNVDTLATVTAQWKWDGTVRSFRCIAIDVTPVK